MFQQSLWSMFLPSTNSLTCSPSPLLRLRLLGLCRCSRGTLASITLATPRDSSRMGVFSWAQGVLPIRSFLIFFSLCFPVPPSRSGLWEGVPAGLYVVRTTSLFAAYMAPGGPALSLGPTSSGSQPMGPWVWGLLALYALIAISPFWISNNTVYWIMAANAS